MLLPKPRETPNAIPPVYVQACIKIKTASAASVCKSERGMMHLDCDRLQWRSRKGKKKGWSSLFFLFLSLRSAAAAAPEIDASLPTLTLCAAPFREISPFVRAATTSRQRSSSAGRTFIPAGFPPVEPRPQRGGTRGPRGEQPIGREGRRDVSADVIVALHPAASSLRRAHQTPRDVDEGAAQCRSPAEQRV